MRWWLIAILAVAAAVSVVANKTESRVLGRVSFALFLGGVAVYIQWRRRSRR